MQCQLEGLKPSIPPRIIAIDDFTSDAFKFVPSLTSIGFLCWQQKIIVFVQCYNICWLVEQKFIGFLYMTWITLHKVWDDNSEGTKYQTVFFTATFLIPPSGNSVHRQNVVSRLHSVLSHNPSHFLETNHETRAETLPSDFAFIYRQSYFLTFSTSSSVLIRGMLATHGRHLLVSCLGSVVCQVIHTLLPSHHHRNLCCVSTSLFPESEKE